MKIQYVNMFLSISHHFGIRKEASRSIREFGPKAF